jgi:hypothetical protein
MCDRLAEHCAREFERHVDELLSIHKRGRILVASPFFRERSVPVDDIPKLKLLVRNALRARAWFARQGPAWAQPLPLSEDEHENIMCSGFFHRHLVGYYSYSLQGRDFHYLEHPLFFDFARGVMASAHVGERGLHVDSELLAEFPAKELPGGLDEVGRWRPLPNRASKLIENLGL